MKIIIYSMLLIGLSEASAAKVDKNRTDKLAADFYSQQHSGRLMSDPHRCEEESQKGPSCADAACGLMGQFGCDSLDEVQKVGSACRGNFSGRCLQSFCKSLGAFGCDSIDEIEQVAAACRGSHNEKCVETACTFMGSFGCDSIDEIQQVGKACSGVDGSCLASVCGRLGSFGCDSIDEIERVARSCRGN